MGMISSKQLLEFTHSLYKKIRENVHDTENSNLLYDLLNEIEKEIEFIRDMNADTEAIIVKTSDEEYHQDEMYTSRELEVAYCIGFLNQDKGNFDLVLDDVPNLVKKWEIGKKFIDLMVRKKRLSNTIQVEDKVVYRD